VVFISIVVVVLQGMGLWVLWERQLLFSLVEGKGRVIRLIVL